MFVLSRLSLASALLACACATAIGCGEEKEVDGPTVPLPPCSQDLPDACPADAPSYTNDVVPILTLHCTKSCHAEGGTAADKLLTDYDDVFKLRGSILDQVYSCRMPPSRTALSEAERDALLAWLVCGAQNN